MVLFYLQQPGCGDGVTCHVRTFLHAGSRITLSIATLPANEALPGEDRGQVRELQFCIYNEQGSGTTTTRWQAWLHHLGKAQGCVMQAKDCPVGRWPFGASLAVEVFTLSVISHQKLSCSQQPLAADHLVSLPCHWGFD